MFLSYSSLQSRCVSLPFAHLGGNVTVRSVVRQPELESICCLLVMTHDTPPNYPVSQSPPVCERYMSWDELNT
jgi:hypothetical protein